MIIDLQARLDEKALRPKFDVALSTYQASHLSFELIGQGRAISNDTASHLPVAQKEIKADEIIFDRQGMEHFRYLLSAITEKLKKDGRTLTQGPAPGRHDSISAYLRPVFNMNTGFDYWDAMREINSRKNPIPKDYFILLPEPGARNPGRDDIIRALIPFQKAQREALTAGWDDGTSAIRISHSTPAPAPASGFILQ